MNKHFLTWEETLQCRAKDKETDEWLVGYIFPTNNAEINLTYIDENGEYIIRPIKKETICRKTHMVDINKKPIFENDKISRLKKQDDTYAYVIEYVGYYIEGGWSGSKGYPIKKSQIRKEKLKVIGNSIDEGVVWNESKNSQGGQPREIELSGERNIFRFPTRYGE